MIWTVWNHCNDVELRDSCREEKRITDGVNNVIYVTDKEDYNQSMHYGREICVFIEFYSYHLAKSYTLPRIFKKDMIEES